MRRAFQIALAMWVIVPLVTHFEASLLLPIVVVAAGGITMLWLAHLIAYTRKIFHVLKDANNSRLKVMLMYIRCLGVSMTLSAVPGSIPADRIYKYFGFTQ
jgi:hypothetical protein